MFAYAVENRLRRWFTGDVHIKFMTINIPQKAAQILRTLNAAGYEPTLSVAASGIPF